MKKKDMFLSIIVLIICIIGLIIGTFILYGNLSSTKNITSNKENEIGTFDYSENNDDVLPDTAEKTADEVIDDNEICPVNLIGIESMPDIFTISVLQRMPYEIRTYLDEHGYADAFNLMIINDSIIADRSYPMFQCEIEDTGHILEIRYELAKKEFEFEIK